MPGLRKTRRKAGYRFGQSDEQPAEALYPGTGTQLESRPSRPRRRRGGKRALKKTRKLPHKV